MGREPETSLGDLPTFVRDRPLTRAALAFAAQSHDGDTRDGDGAPFILHPLEVGSLLSSCDCTDEVTAAAVLHDTLEDTAATAAQIEAGFGSSVARLVCSLTEDAQVGDLRERKSALRDQVEEAGRDAAMIYAADKLSKVRELRILLHADPRFAAQPRGQQKLEHYWWSLALLERTLGSEPLVRQLRFELEAIRDLPPRGTSREALGCAIPSALAPPAGR
jgi:(p)ppGpp synthase/HD superfamily hydrolase